MSDIYQVKKIKVTVETTTDDGSVSNLTFGMDPRSFQMSQSRNVQPVYDPTECMTWGRPTGFKIGKTTLNISGFVVKEGPE